MAGDSTETSILMWDSTDTDLLDLDDLDIFFNLPEGISALRMIIF